MSTSSVNSMGLVSYEAFIRRAIEAATAVGLSSQHPMRNRTGNLSRREEKARSNRRVFTSPPSPHRAHQARTGGYLHTP